MGLNLADSVDSDLNAAKAEKDGSNLTNTSQWRTNLSLLSALENHDLVLSRPPIRGVAFNPGVSATRLLATTKQTIGTASFTLWFRVTIPNAAGNFGIGGLSSSSTTIAAANGFGVRLTSGGALRVTIFGATTADFRYVEVASFTTSYVRRTVDIQVVRDVSAGTVVVYLNGVAATTAETTGGTPPAWSATVDGTYCLAGTHDATQIWPGRMYRATLLNFAASALEVADFVAHGLPAYYASGTNVAIIDGGTLNGGFETAGSPHASWAKTEAGSSTVTDEASIVHGGSHACKMTIDGSGSFASITSTTLLEPGAAYEARIWARADSGSPTIAVTALTVPADVTVESAATLTATYALYTILFQAAGAAFAIKRNSATGRIIYLDDITLIRRGALVDMDLTCGKGTTIPDRSGNHIQAQAFGIVNHIGEATSGDLLYCVTLNHNEISATAATTKIFDLPDNCATFEIEPDRETAFDSGVTVDVGITGTPDKYASAIAMDATGKTRVVSSSLASESASATTAVYLKKSGVTSVGKCTFRVRVQIKGNKSL